jgi:hypothetical protein
VATVFTVQLQRWDSEVKMSKVDTFIDEIVCMMRAHGLDDVAQLVLSDVAPSFAGDMRALGIIEPRGLSGKSWRLTRSGRALVAAKRASNI